jgi:hypothetical protein
MSTLNAIGFVICGLVMGMLPFVAPHYFPVGTMPGGTSTLWVEFMGWVNGLIGGTYLLMERGLAFLHRQLALNAALQKAIVEQAKILRPALPGELTVRPLAQHQAA